MKWFSNELSLRSLALVAVVVLFGFLGSRGLNEPDEGRYAEIGREMAVTGDWLVPHLNGFEHFQKPPLLYWMTAASIRIGGANEWAARMPSALAALGTVLLTAWIGRMLFTKELAVTASLILLSTAGFFLIARLLTADMLLTFWITAALAFYVRHFTGKDERWSGYLFFVALGFGFLTKGPMALVVPLCAVLTHRFSQPRNSTPALPWVSGLVLTFAIGLSWFVAVSLWRHELFEYFWRYELVERFASSTHGRSKPWWFFVPVILIATTPWVFLFPALAKRAWGLFRQRRIPVAGWLLVGWIIPPFLILSLSGSKLPTYILPLLPAIALGFAWTATSQRIRNSRIVAIALTLLVVGLGCAAVFPLFNDHLGPQASIRDLVHDALQDPELQNARFHAVEVRAHGLEFYLQRLSTATKEQADIVLPPTPAQRDRLLSTARLDAASILPAAGRPPVAVLTRRNRARASFPPAQWREIGRAGDFVMLKSIAEKVEPTQPE